MDFKPYEGTLTLNLFPALKKVDPAFATLECVVEGVMKDGSGKRHHLVDFQYHVGGLPEHLVWKRTKAWEEDDELLRVRHNREVNERHKRDFAYKFYPRAVVDLERDFWSTARYAPGWERESQAYKDKKAYRNWVYGDIGPLSGDDFDLDLDDSDLGSDDLDWDSEDSEF